MVERKTYSRLFWTEIFTSCIDFKCKINDTQDALKYLYFCLSYLFLFPSWFYPYELCCLKCCTTSYTKHTYVCEFIYEPRHKKTCILKCENKKALTRNVLTCWSTQFLKFNILFQDSNTDLSYRANAKNRNISNNNSQL